MQELALPGKSEAERLAILADITGLCAQITGLDGRITALINRLPAATAALPAPADSTNSLTLETLRGIAARATSMTIRAHS